MQIVRHLGHEPSLDLPPIGHPFIMGATRMRDVLVNLLTATNKIIRFGLGVGVFGVGLLWPDLAHADVSDTPPHRLELNVAPNLPKCNDYDSFYGIITNWITIRSLNPTAEKKLSISIKRIPKGDKVVYLSVSDPDGVEMFHDMHSYQPSPECFTVLYWTAFDATRLLRQTIPLPEEEPPMSVDELVAEVEKPERVQKKGSNLVAYMELASSLAQERAAPEKEKESPLPNHLALGVVASLGLLPEPMPGLRFGYGRSVGVFMFELEALAFPPIVSAELDGDFSDRASVRSQLYGASAGACLRRVPFFGCAVAMGGWLSTQCDERNLDIDPKYPPARSTGLFSVGVRAGVEIPLKRSFALRLEAEAQFLLHQPAPFFDVRSDERDARIPIGTTYVSFAQSF